VPPLASLRDVKTIPGGLRSKENINYFFNLGGVLYRKVVVFWQKVVRK